MLKIIEWLQGHKIQEPDGKRSFIIPGAVGSSLPSWKQARDPSSRPTTRHPDDVPEALVTGTEGFILNITTSSSQKTERDA